MGPPSIHCAKERVPIMYICFEGPKNGTQLKLWFNLLHGNFYAKEHTRQTHKYSQTNLTCNYMKEYVDGTLHH